MRRRGRASPCNSERPTSGEPTNSEHSPPMTKTSSTPTSRYFTGPCYLPPADSNMPNNGWIEFKCYYGGSGWANAHRFEGRRKMWPCLWATMQCITVPRSKAALPRKQRRGEAMGRAGAASPSADHMALLNKRSTSAPRGAGCRTMCSAPPRPPAYRRLCGMPAIRGALPGGLWRGFAGP